MAVLCYCINYNLLFNDKLINSLGNIVGMQVLATMMQQNVTLIVVTIVMAIFIMAILVLLVLQERVVTATRILAAIPLVAVKIAQQRLAILTRAAITLL